IGILALQRRLVDLMIAKSDINRDPGPERFHRSLEIGIFHQMAAYTGVGAIGKIAGALEKDRLVLHGGSHHRPGMLVIGPPEIALPSAGGSPVGAGKGKRKGLTAALGRRRKHFMAFGTSTIDNLIFINCRRLQPGDRNLMSRRLLLI